MMGLFGINLFGLFVIAAGAVGVAFAINLVWLNEDMRQTTKVVLAAGAMVLWFGMVSAIYTIANSPTDPFSCTPVDYVLNVDGKVVFVSKQGSFAKVCQDKHSGRVFLSGPNGEFK